MSAKIDKPINQKKNREPASKSVYGKCVHKMCEGCTLYGGKKKRCPIQEEPGWLMVTSGECWSKRTDPDVDKQILRDIERYKIFMNERALP